MSDANASNPLLTDSSLPAFTQIRPEHVEPAIRALIADHRRAIEEILDATDSSPAPTWESFVEPVTLLANRLAKAWSPVSHLNSVANSDELREAYNASLSMLTEFHAEMGQNVRLFEAYQSVADNDSTLGAQQRKVLDNALRDFRLSGVDLAPENKARFKETSQQLSKLSSDFSDKVLDANNAWSKSVASVEALRGLPESAIALAQQAAAQRGQTGYLLTLDIPCYLPVMTYADDDALRRELYTAFNTRASDEGPHAGRFDNSENMASILALRHEQAQLLGFPNYAELSLATKMARSTEEVMQFLEELAARSRTQAQQELAGLQAFTQKHYARDVLEPWDIAYYSEKFRQHSFDISEEEVKPYFPLDRVIDGMFAVVKRLFDVEMQRVENVDLYHPDVRFYAIRDPDGTTRAQFYFDLFARPQKRGGAWMDVCQSRMRAGSYAQIPVAYMVCNFTPPVDGKAPLLTHREVETLFHEFGHGLHHMLTRIDHYDIAGIHGVAWDAVELPSQFMENYCWEREALDLFAAHFETGELIPDDLYQRMLAAKNFQSGMMMVRQLEFSLLDFRMHLEFDAKQGDRIYAILGDVRETVSVLQAPEWNRFAHAFSHVFGGGYAAGYYSYKWAEVLSADAFSLFEEQGVFDQPTGAAFLNHILSRGGSKDAMELFTSFRGREPKIDALLRHTGIAA